MPNRIYPKIKNTIHLCLTFIGLTLAADILSRLTLYIIGFSGVHISENMNSFISTVFQIAVYMIIVKSLIAKSYVDKVDFHHWKKLNLTVVFLFLLLFSGAEILFSQIDYLFFFILPMPDFLVDTFFRIFNLDSLFLSLLGIVLVPAIFEEVLFRGFILFGLNKNYSDRKSIFISSLLFGLVHLNPWQFLTAFLIGMIFGWIALKTKSIILPVAGHFLNNLLALIGSRYFDMEINPFGQFEMQPLWLNLTGILLFTLGAYLLHQYYQNSEKKKETSHYDYQTTETD
jgi:CAAX protease family protein